MCVTVTPSCITDTEHTHFSWSQRLGCLQLRDLLWMRVSGDPAKDTLREAGWRERGGDRQELESATTSKTAVVTAAQST